MMDMGTDDPTKPSAAEALARLRAQKPATPQRSASDALAELRAQNGPPSGAGEGILDSGLDMLTLGAHSKLLGLTQAAGDLITHGVNAHPVDTYNASLAATDKRKAAADVEHPLLRRAADATGFFGSIAAEAPVRALLGLPKAVAAANGGKTAIGRIGEAARSSAAHGAQYGAAAGAIGSRASTPDQAINDVGAGALEGGILGRILGGGSAAVGEGVRNIQSVLGPLLASGEERAQTLANRLIAPAIDANAIPRRAAQAQATRNTGATLAHLGTPALDQLTYLSTSGATPEAAALRDALSQAQRGEHDVIQHGVTAMSGRENVPRNNATNFLNSLEDQRVAAGAVDYPKAYAGPDITDPRVLDAIANEPYLSGSLDKSVDILNRKGRAASLRTGQPASDVINPLTSRDGGQSAIEAQLASYYKDDPIKLALARQKAGLPPAPVSASGSIPVQMLDKLQQAAQPGIERGLNQGHLAAEDAGAINSQLQSILRMADESSPDFQAARARQASFFGRGEGGQAGMKAFNKTGPEIANDIAGFERPGQSEAYRTTATSQLRNAIDAKGYGADVGRSLFDNPEMEGQLDALFGPGARERLAPALEQGSILNRVLGASAEKGSQTAYRTKINENLGDPAINDVIHTLLNPKRAMYNLPGKLIDRAGKSTQQEALRINAARLATPANSTDLRSVLESILEPAPVYGGRPLLEGPRGAKPGFLAHLLFQGDQQ